MTTTPLPKAPFADCENCPLKEAPCARTTGHGGKVAFVSRSPGRSEALEGKAFSGPSGRVLDHMLHLYGYSRENVVATNVVLCQCEEVPQAAINACSGRLANEIKDCDIIIAAGVEAAKTLAGVDSVHRNRGHVYTFGSNGTRLVITNNPAVVLRDERGYPDLVKDFRLALAPRQKHDLPEVKYTDDKAEAKRWIEHLHNQFQTQRAYLTGCDIETRGTAGRSGLERGAEVVCISFAQRSSRSVCFGERICEDRDFFVNHIGPLLEYPKEQIRYLWHNGKYDVQAIRDYGINARVDEDTLLLSWALDERPGDPQKGWTGHSLEYLLKDYLGFPKYEPPSVGVFKKTGTLENAEELYIYNGIDTAGCVGLYESLREAAELDNVLQKPYYSHLLPLNAALLDIEKGGWLFNDKLAADILEEQVWPKLLELEAEARRLAGRQGLNLNSPQQLMDLYYNQWHLKHNLRRPGVENKGKISSDKFVRKEILEDRFTSSNDFLVKEFTKQLDRHSELDTQRTNFYEALIRRQFPDGRIYYTFLIHGTETGRLSGRNPNMQNVTRPKAGLPSIRECFIAEPGHVILNCDLSQAELRSIAQLSHDEYMQSIFKDSSRSLHKEVAAQFYGDDYTGEQYVAAKNINFGVAYLQSAFTFHQMYGMDQSEAQAFIDWWFSRFPRVHEWIQAITREVLTTGELQSPFGHKRRFYLITNQNRDHIIKQGVNYLPQNIAANLTLYAMIEIQQTLDPKIAQIKGNVHDAIVLHVKRSHVEEVANYVLDVMESAPKKALGWDLPFKAEAKYGPNWGTLTEAIERD